MRPVFPLANRPDGDDRRPHLAQTKRLPDWHPLDNTNGLFLRLPISLGIMRLGIDFGTTRTIVVQVDRGNYPVVGFTDAAGDFCEYFPSLVGETDGRLHYGFDALATPDATLVRSFKRVMASPGVNPETPVTVGSVQVGILDLLVGYLSALRAALAADSTIEVPADAVLDAVVAVPAHAHSAQRFITLEAFRRAGFNVVAMLNEPSAAGFEYTHRQGKTVSSRRTRVLVYDLGGGTFDASLVDVSGRDHVVLDSIGVNRLGGDDFDEVLAGMALAQVGKDAEELGVAGYFDLLEECRAAKERLAPQTKRIALEVAGEPVTIVVDDFYAAVSPLAERTIAAMAPLVDGLDAGLAEVAGIYLVGGSSGLPLVPRALRAHYGRRVHRSPYPAASTAIGLAIAADPESGFSLTDRLSRGFGVFREGAGGATVQFDALLSRSERVSATSDIVVTRRYRAAHNVGWFRFVEYATLSESGDPKGEVVPFAEVLFPFDASLEGRADLAGVTVQRLGSGPLVEESYTIDPHGIIAVRLTNLDTEYTHETVLR